MHIVIDIPDKTYEYFAQGLRFSDDVEEAIVAIVDGIQLPKGHGRLSDMDDLTKSIVKEYGVNSINELPQDIKMFYDKFIRYAPTILDATIDYKLKNYAFFRK